MPVLVDPAVPGREPAVPTATPRRVSTSAATRIRPSACPPHALRVPYSWLQPTSSQTISGRIHPPARDSRDGAGFWRRSWPS